jgi:hypothetical protein
MGTVVAVLGVVTASAAGAPEVSIPLLLGGGVGASSRDNAPIISFTPLPLLACCVAPADMVGGCWTRMLVVCMQGGDKASILPFLSSQNTRDGERAVC